MSFWDDWSGKSAQKDIQQGQQQANTYLDQGEAAASKGYADAGKRYDVFADYGKGGNAFFKRYGDSMGVNGADAQRAVQQEYMADPIQEMLRERIARTNTRAAIASPTGYNSGATTQSLTNAMLASWKDYQAGLQSGSQVGGQIGMQAAGGQAASDIGAGDMHASIANQRAGLATSTANANAASRSTGINNLLGAAGVLTQGFGIGAKAAGWGGFGK